MSRRRSSSTTIPTLRGRRSPPRRTPQDNVRAAAAWAVERILASRAPGDTYLESALSRCDELDHALLTELVLGTLRWLRRIDHLITAAANRPLKKIEPVLYAPLRVATYQLLFLDRVPAHAVVNEAVEQARSLTHRGGTSFVNAVLRRLARENDLESWPVRGGDEVARLAVEMSHPDFLVERWLERFGRRPTMALLRANNRPKPMHLMAFRERGGRELLAEALIDAGVEIEPSRISPLGLVVRSGSPLRSEAFRRGDLYVQDEASQAAALIPPPRPGERILDVAAAPGGKSFTLLGWEPTVRCVLADVALARMSTLQENLRRLGRPLPVLAMDGRRPALGGGFDRVLVDAPCSGTGTLRKHPEIKWRLSPEEIERLAAQSLELMRGVAPLVGPGGYLVLSTCSLEEEENERVIERFLELEHGFAPVSLQNLLMPPVEESILGPGLWRLLPGADHDGFTVSVLMRRP